MGEAPAFDNDKTPIDEREHLLRLLTYTECKHLFLQASTICWTGCMGGGLIWRSIPDPSIFCPASESTTPQLKQPEGTQFSAGGYASSSVAAEPSEPQQDELRYVDLLTLTYDSDDEEDRAGGLIFLPGTTTTEDVSNVFKNKHLRAAVRQGNDVRGIWGNDE